MGMEGFDYMGWVVIPSLIFIARLADVSLATLRHILVFKGMRKIVPIFGFFEIMIWLVAITQVMQNLSNIACYLGFGLGFAAGTYVGIVVEEKLALGHQLVRIITRKPLPDLHRLLIDSGYGVTVVPARGSQGAVEIFFVATARKRMPGLLGVLREFDPNLFFTIEDVRSVASGIFARPGSGPALAMEGTLKRK